MKKIIIGLLLIGSITNLSAQTKKMKTYWDYYKTKVKESYSVLVSNPTKKHGYYKVYYKNSVIAIEGKYTNGKETGKWISRYEHNGEIALIMYFDSKGLQMGVEKKWCDDENHRLHVEGNYSKAKKIGFHKTYYCNSGKIKFLREFKDGLQHGKSTEYNKNGNVEYAYEYSEGVLTNEQKYYENGQKSFEKNKIALTKEMWYENGKPKEKTHYNSKWNKNGLSTKWDQNGTVVFEDTFIDGDSENKIAAAKAKEEASQAVEKENRRLAYVAKLKREAEAKDLAEFNEAKKIADAKYQELTDLFFTPKKNGRWTIKGRTGSFDLKKEHLYQAFIIYYNYAMKIDDEWKDDMVFKIGAQTSAAYLCDKVMGFFNSDSKAMEKQLKNLEDPVQIEKIFGYGQ
ncbi:MAG: hypothetical protein COA97_05055 [Flavobacteriales bacterium]|nr:MAG: hypothetical protein COA97_05055 [Flavobacteriales bacterium]